MAESMAESEAGKTSIFGAESEFGGGNIDD